MRMIPPKALDATISYKDILSEPSLYPAGLVEQVLRICTEMYTPKDPFAFEGYDLYGGYVGVHPNSSDEAKKEWMEYWKASKGIYESGGITVDENGELWLTLG